MIPFFFSIIMSKREEKFFSNIKKKYSYHVSFIRFIWSNSISIFYILKKITLYNMIFVFNKCLIRSSRNLKHNFDCIRPHAYATYVVLTILSLNMSTLQTSTRNPYPIPLRSQSVKWEYICPLHQHNSLLTTQSTTIFDIYH